MPLHADGPRFVFRRFEAACAPVIGGVNRLREEELRGSLGLGLGQAYADLYSLMLEGLLPRPK